MTLEERLRVLAESLPSNGSVVLTRSDLEELLGEDPGRPAGCPRGPEAADLTVAEVAERFRRKPQTVRDWIRDGDLAAYKFNDREWRITAAALAKFEDRRRYGGFQRNLAPDPSCLSEWRGG